VLTQCPNCDTTFRVTSEILRVAQGQVRCGRCETQFDALERLIEEDDAVEADDSDMQLSEPDLEDDPEIEEQEEDAEPAEEWVEFDDISAADEADSAAETIAEEDAADVEVVEEEPDDYSEAEEFEEAEEEEVAAVPTSRIRGNYVPERRDRSPIAPLQSAVGKQAPSFEDTDQFELSKPRLRMPTPVAWKYLAIPLVLLLSLQVLNHYRAPLARNPRFGRAVSGIYRLLGVDVIPDWDLRAYKIKRSVVVFDPTTPGTLRVQASVRNRAPFPQPYPLLRLVLSDRFGEPLRAREFEPLEYLGKTLPPDARMTPQQEITVNLAIVDPGLDASGSRFDVCLRGNNGPVCAEDLPVIAR
jgi:predicted Zn finger-like uncharacterized protein